MSDTPMDCEHGQLARACRICELERELAAERERADRAQEGAERYQWLRMNRLWLKANLPMIHAGAFDAAIDAARRK